ncbi:hypothetical protein AAFF_G00141270 [Aldrovandia affinis]|uniref:Uncharacterized protein n=1 Tax=Aldrovandia affinis TaxID=143900 RepID=A0AAD7TCT1_9TELE|nr:hypothetical protein AAFF_G00141270 [Aldrovandia affinis]
MDHGCLLFESRAQDSCDTPEPKSKPLSIPLKEQQRTGYLLEYLKRSSASRHSDGQNTASHPSRTTGLITRDPQDQKETGRTPKPPPHRRPPTLLARGHRRPYLSNSHYQGNVDKGSGSRPQAEGGVRP